MGESLREFKEYQSSFPRRSYYKSITRKN